MPGMLQSRKVWAAIVGLIFVLANAYLNKTQIDPNTVTNAIMGIVAALMASIAYEDGQKARAEAMPTTTITTPSPNVDVSTSDTATPPPVVPHVPGKPGFPGSVP